MIRNPSSGARPSRLLSRARTHSHRSFVRPPVLNHFEKAPVTACNNLTAAPSDRDHLLAFKLASRHDLGNIGPCRSYRSPIVSTMVGRSTYALVVRNYEVWGKSDKLLVRSSAGMFACPTREIVNLKCRGTAVVFPLHYLVFTLRALSPAVTGQDAWLYQPLTKKKRCS